MLKYVPLNKIDRMQIYINKSRKAMAKIKKEMGADDIINAGFFNGNWHYISIKDKVGCICEWKYYKKKSV